MSALELPADAIDLLQSTLPWGTWPGSGGVWFRRSKDLPDGNFTDWGAAVAVKEIVNASPAMAAEIRRLEREVAALQGVREAAWRLLREAELDDMERRAGWDCWMLHLRAALKATSPAGPLEGESADLIGGAGE